MMATLTRLVGKMHRSKAYAEAIMIFRVGGKYYPATKANKEQFEAYLHTGDELYLMDLEKEMEV